MSDDDNLKLVRIPFGHGSHHLVLAEHGIFPPEETAWTPELVERFIRLAEAQEQGRFDEQWDIEFHPEDTKTPEGVIETAEVEDLRAHKDYVGHLFSDLREMAEAGQIEQVGLKVGPKPPEAK